MHGLVSVCASLHHSTEAPASGRSDRRVGAKRAGFLVSRARQRRPLAPDELEGKPL